MNCKREEGRRNLVSKAAQLDLRTTLPFLHNLHVHPPKMTHKGIDVDNFPSARSLRKYETCFQVLLMADAEHCASSVYID